MTIRFNWGFAVAIVYTTFAVGTLSVVMLAIRTPVDLVSPDYYERSLAFDHQIEAAARGRESGVTVRLDPSAEPPRVIVTFPASGRPASGTLTFYRASSSQSDRVLPLAIDVAGRQSFDLQGLPSGHWTAEVRWTSDGHDAYVEQEIVAP